MGLGDTLSNAGLNLSFGGINANTIALFLIFFFCVMVIVGVLSWWLWNRTYNKDIILVREINGTPAFAGETKAKEIVLRGTSVRGFKVKKPDIILTRPYLETGKDKFLYWIRDDGEWVNIRLENLNETMKELKVKYAHTDMRMENASLRKLVEDQYQAGDWLKTWMPFIAVGILLILLAIGGFLFMKGANNVVSGLATSTQQMALLVEKITEALASVDNICSAGGLRPA